ncbi:MarR family winged helix-turn-helix transcriptional regulator [Glaciihabitans sp. dw_435]|uniref:MarR family winged helix-turn-helix transcriptional regulator n=1 Tax=Glaciihabitans sp. dw_435 TaxID=2720081 RepID=UPI001BD40FD9|nr:MarR family transcriptional regulator [Glaciihabitans sp. dw_435]
MTPQPDDDIGEQLRAAIGQFVRAGRAETDTLPPAYIETMGFLIREGPLSVADLARRRQIRHQSQSATITELRALGFVDRSADPGDGRGWLIELTPSGTEEILALRARRAALIGQLSARLTDEERQILARIPGILLKLASP